jgi:hypothetical protein
VKKVCDKVDNLLAEFSEENRGKAKTFSDVLNEKLGVLSDLDASILGNIDDEDIEKEIDEASEIRCYIQERIVNIELVLPIDEVASVENSLVSSKNSETSSKNGQSETSGKNGQSERVKNNIKLPKLEIKKFHGKHSEYQTFRESFEAAIHSNESLSDIEKLNYLRSYLEGPAAASIAGLSLTNENYKIAVDILNERYGNKQLVISSHMDSLLKIPPVTDANDKRMRPLYDQIEVNVRSLQALGVSAEMYGSLLIPVLMEKIPNEFQLIISRQMKSDTWDITKLLDIFKEELEAREKTRGAGGSTEKPGPKGGRYKDPPTTAAALYANDATQAACYLCDQPGHRSYKCTIVTDPEKCKGILKKKGRCFLCLKSGHIVRNCPSEMKCMKCGAKHHSIVCKTPPKIKPVGSNDDQQSPPGSNLATTATNYVDTETSVLLQTAVAEVTNPGSKKSVKARLIFDSGSQQSYISNRIRNVLELPAIGTENLLIKTFGSEKEQPKSCDVVKFSLNKPGGGIHLYVDAFSVETICSPVSKQKIRVAKASYDHLSSLDLADSCDGKVDMPVDILIGSDYYWQFVTGETRRGKHGGPVAVKTHLGWVLSGPVVEVSQSLLESSVCMSNTHVLRLDTEEVAEPCSLRKEVAKFWETESIGIVPESEDAVHQQFLNEIQMKDGRYEVSLPWKDGHPTLPDNYNLSCTRLGSTLRRLRRTPEILREYDRVIRDQEKKGIIEAVNPTLTSNKIHYLPHREIIRTDKQTTKLRIVFDASAKKDGPSLNDCIHAGPSLSPLLMDVMLRFRCFKVALVADIEKAFLMIGVDENDRDALRFLWIDDVDSEHPKVVTKRFTRLVFGVSSSPFLLNATLRYHINKYTVADPEFVRRFLEALYVDDLTSGDQSVEEAYQLFLKSKLRMLEAGCNLRKWTSNSSELIERIRESDCAGYEAQETRSVIEDDHSYTSTTLGVDHEINEEIEHKVLGLLWNPRTDELIIDFKPILEVAANLPVTKRTVLKVTAQVYDPLGWISPIIVDMKVLFQKICEMKGDWDDELTPELKESYERWLKELSNAGTVKLSRCYFNGNDLETASIELHGFSDASSYAYAAAVYIRIVYPSDIRVVLVAAKTRVAPLSGCTIPRLELLAAVILARLVRNVQRALSQILNIDNIRCWIDSMVVLYWIVQTDKTWKQFVQNRVLEIRNNVDPNQWSYCNTAVNPADLPSRGAKATQLIEADTWWNGPTFLKLPEEQWPTKPQGTSQDEEAMKEVKTESKNKSTCTNLTTSLNASVGNCIRLEEFSSSKKLFRVTAYVIRFIAKLKSQLPNLTEFQKSAEGALTVKELEHAETIWLREIQKPIVASDKFGQIKNSLGLFVDGTGVYRCKGRLGKSCISSLRDEVSSFVATKESSYIVDRTRMP